MFFDFACFLCDSFFERANIFFDGELCPFEGLSFLLDRREVPRIRSGIEFIFGMFVTILGFDELIFPFVQEVLRLIELLLLALSSSTFLILLSTLMRSLSCSRSSFWSSINTAICSFNVILSVKIKRLVPKLFRYEPFLDCRI